MKKSELTFLEGFTIGKSKVKEAKFAKKNPKVFDWDKCALIIKEKLLLYPNLVAEAGLKRDWNCTGGIIFENGKPTDENYTYLYSDWSIPTLLIFNDGFEIEEIECYTEDLGRFTENSKWDDISLNLLKN